MKAKELMNADKLKVCTPETKVADVAKIMKDSNKGALPVVDKTDKVVGILTDRDLALSLSKNAKKSVAEISVKEVLPKGKLCTVKPDDEIRDVLREMRRNKIGRLPVVDTEGKLMGMISVNNILSRAVTRNEAIGQLSSKDENLAKTIKALFERNSSSSPVVKKEVLEMEPSDE
jgi:CBS domain-containing protein